MELTEKYIYKIYEEKSVSSAAKKLFISQPALSTMLAKQEKKLGFKIFDRSTSPLSLTEKGRIYIEHLHDVVESELQMHQKIKQLSETSLKTLSIGGSIQLNYYLVPLICKELYRKYPDIILNIDIGHSHSNEKFYEKLKRHTLDVVLSYSEGTNDFDAIPVINERFLIAMHKSIAEKNNLMHLSVTKQEFYDKSYSKDREISDFSSFKNVEFFYYNSPNIKNKLITELLGDNLKTVKCHIKNSKHLTPHYSFICAGIGASIIPDSHLFLPEFQSDDIVHFVPKNELCTRTLFFLVNKERSENPILDEFIDIAKKLAEKIQKGLL